MQTIISRTALFSRSSFNIWLLPLLASVVFIVGAIFVSEDAIAGNTVYPMLITGVLGVVGLTAYVYYLDFVHSKPNFLLYFITIFQPVLIFGCSVVEAMGANPHTRLLLFLLVMFPAALMIPQVYKSMGKDYGFIKWFLIFLAWISGYYFFNNKHVVDPRFDHSGSVSGGSISFGVYMAYVYFAGSMILTVFAVKKKEFSAQVLSKLNTWLSIVVILYSVSAVIAYFLKIGMVELEGVKRVALIFGHPNPFAFYMGLMMLYLLGSGMLGIFSNDKKQNIFWMISALIGMVGFLTAMSKTTIVGLGAAVFFLLLVTLIKRPGIKTILATAGMVTMVALLLTLDSGLMDTLASRFERNNSLEWRLEAWNSLLYKMKPESWALGYGFSASNEAMLEIQILQSEMTADLVKTAPIIQVHNAFISHLYDFGVMGLLPMLGLVLLVIKGLKHLFSLRHSRVSNIYLLIAGMIIYFLCISFFDMAFECLLLPFWSMLILIYSQLPAIQQKELSNVG